MRMRMYLCIGVLILLLAVGSASSDINSSSYLIGNTVGYGHVTDDKDRAGEWATNPHFMSYYEGVVIGSWYDFVLVECKDGTKEWINIGNILKLFKSIDVYSVSAVGKGISGTMMVENI
jgi:hypothetical protein